MHFDNQPSKFFRFDETIKMRGIAGILFIAIFFNIKSFAGDSGFECELQGELLSQSYGSKRPDVEQHKIFFHIWIRGHEWLIHTEPDPKELKDSVSSYREIGCDGTNTYRVAVYNPVFDNTAAMRKAVNAFTDALTSTNLEPQAERILREKKRELESRLASGNSSAVARNGAEGSKEPVIYAQFEPADPNTALLWLAFCSGDFFAKYGDRRLPPIWRLGEPPFTNMIPTQVTRNKLFPNLPDKVTYFDGDVPSANYLASPVTNMVSLSYPTMFSLVINSTNSLTNSVVRFKSEGIVKQFKSTCDRVSFRPDVPAGTVIQDSVVNNGMGARYRLAPGVWPATTDLNELRNHDKEIAKLKMISRERRVAVVKTCLMVLAVIGLGMIIKTTVKMKR